MFNCSNTTKWAIKLLSQLAVLEEKIEFFACQKTCACTCEYFFMYVDCGKWIQVILTSLGRDGTKIVHT